MNLKRWYNRLSKQEKLTIYDFCAKIENMERNNERIILEDDFTTATISEEWQND